MRFSMFALAATLLLVEPVGAFAQESSDSDAAELVRSGVASAQRGDHADAIELFERARVLEPNDRIDLMLAESLVEVGRWHDAESMLVRLAHAPSVHPLVGEMAGELLDRLESQAAQLDVRVSPVPADAFLMVDGWRQASARSSMVLRVAPGEHVLAVAARDGEILARVRVELGELDRRTVALRTVLPSLRGTPDEGPIDPWPWVALGLGTGLAIAIGVIVGLAVVITTPSP